LQSIIKTTNTAKFNYGKHNQKSDNDDAVHKLCSQSSQSADC